MGGRPGIAPSPRSRPFPLAHAAVHDRLYVHSHPQLVGGGGLARSSVADGAEDEADSEDDEAASLVAHHLAEVRSLPAKDGRGAVAQWGAGMGGPT